MDGWQWYYSVDGGERYHGPCDDRLSAVAAGEQAAREQELGAFEICEAQKGRLRNLMEGRLADWLDDANEGMDDPEGDPISFNVTAAQWRDLERRFVVAAQDWADAHNLHSNVWLFDGQRHAETIEVPDAPPGDGEA